MKRLFPWNDSEIDHRYLTHNEFETRHDFLWRWHEKTEESVHVLKGYVEDLGRSLDRILRNEARLQANQDKLRQDFDSTKSALADRDTRRVNRIIMDPDRVQDATGLTPDMQKLVHSYQKRRSSHSKSTAGHSRTSRKSAKKRRRVRPSRRR